MSDIRINKALADANPKRARRALVAERAEQALASIDSDLALLETATTAQTKTIIGRLLKRQRAIILYLSRNL